MCNKLLYITIRLMVFITIATSIATYFPSPPIHTRVTTLHNNTETETIPPFIRRPFSRTLDTTLTFYQSHPARLIFTNLVLADLQAAADTIPALTNPGALFRGLEHRGVAVKVKLSNLAAGNPEKPAGMTNGEAKAEMAVVTEKVRKIGSRTRPAYWSVSVEGESGERNIAIGIGGFD